MLGSLTRWLRIIGYDTEYKRNSDDDSLMDEAYKENRVLVTRDRELFLRARKRGLVSVLIESEGDVKQLSEIAKKMGLILEPRENRCPKCNGLLLKKDKEELKGRVPSASLKAFNEFWVCDSCGSVYWKGSHWGQILLTIENAKKN
jgi:uncharacterized protein with PIN domain